MNENNEYRLVGDELPEAGKVLWLFWDTSKITSLHPSDEVFEVGYYGTPQDEYGRCFYCKEINDNGNYYDVVLVEPTHWKYAEYPKGVKNE